MFKRKLLLLLPYEAVLKLIHPFKRGNFSGFSWILKRKIEKIGFFERKKLIITNELFFAMGLNY